MKSDHPSYTVDEIMCATLAAQFADGDEVCNGMASFIPVAAIMLARLTTAPELVWLAGAAGVDPRPDRVPASTLESPLWRDSVMYLEQFSDFWHYAQSGRHLQTFCVGAAQLDRYGNANNSIIGDDYHRPKVRLPGTAGLADMGALGKRLLYWNPNHSPRALVEKVDFVSCPGYLGGGDERERLGLGGGPEFVVTNLAVLDFDPESTCHAPPVGASRRDRRAGAGGDRLRADRARGGGGDAEADGGAGAAAARGDRSRRDVQARSRGRALMEFEFGAPGTIMPPADKAVDLAKRAEADGYDSIWWPSHLMGWHPESVWTEDITPLAQFQANPHTYFDPLVMMPVVGAQTERIQRRRRRHRRHHPPPGRAGSDGAHDRPRHEGPHDPRARLR